MSELVETSVKVAAKRGFIRTAAQSLSSIIPTGTISIVLTGDWALGAVLGIASAVVTAGMAGAASYFSIIGKGIPEDYKA